MKAFYVYDRKKDLDLIIIPQNDTMAEVDKGAMEVFIGVHPKFETLKTTRLNGLKPEQFGTIAATRDDDGDVCIVDAELWRERMGRFL